jgi:hypothetical protein
MTAPRAKIATQTGQALAQLCHERAASELAYLEATLDHLRRVRGALTSTQPDRLAAAVQNAQSAAGAFRGMEAERNRFREQAGALLGMAPHAVTLGKAIDSLPSDLAKPLRELRQRLREMASEMDRVNQANALISWWRLDFLHQVFAGLPGVMSSGRYSQRGKLQTPTCVPLWQTRG